MKAQFIGEEIRPVAEALDFSHAAPGEPAFPRKFLWRKEIVEIETVIKKWKTTGPCTHGSDERYVRKHWLEIITSDHRHMTIYFDRKAESGHRIKRRWWLYTVTEQEAHLHESSKKAHERGAAREGAGRTPS